ncbi:MAG: hypothetical protein FWH11_10250 [Micrococcales bacterium]|nr:hypothetical protein [Micrococcales bacterium]
MRRLTARAFLPLTIAAVVATTLAGCDDTPTDPATGSDSPAAQQGTSATADDVTVESVVGTYEWNDIQHADGTYWSVANPVGDIGLTPRLVLNADMTMLIDNTDGSDDEPGTWEIIGGDSIALHGEWGSFAATIDSSGRLVEEADEDGNRVIYARIDCGVLAGAKDICSDVWGWDRTSTARADGNRDDGHLTFDRDGTFYQDNFICEPSEGAVIDIEELTGRWEKNGSGLTLTYTDGTTAKVELTNNLVVHVGAATITYTPRIMD